MIYIRIERFSRENPHILAFEVKGHAQYDVAGKDIVCSAVSATTVGTLNAIETLTRLTLNHKMRKGYLAVSIVDDARCDEEKFKNLQLLLESMVVILQTIHESYRDYITINTLYQKGG